MTRPAFVVVNPCPPRVKDALIDQLPPARGIATIASSWLADRCVIFGMCDQARELFEFGDVMRLEYLHEEYIAGRMRPGGDSAYFACLVEGYLGRKPLPSDDADEICQAILWRQMGFLKAGASGAHAFTGANAGDPKRLAALDQLQQIEDETDGAS